MSNGICSKHERAAILLLFLSNMVFCLTIWLEHTYDQVRFDQILYLFKSPSTGVQSALSASAVLCVGMIPAAITALEAWLYLLLLGRRHLKHLKNIRFPSDRHNAVAVFLNQHLLPLTIVLLLISLVILGIRINFYRYMSARSTESDFIQTHYANPDNVTLHFPEQKRNLVYIFLESMESTYSDPTAGDLITACYIPELKELAENNLNFSHEDGLGGALSYPGTTWTAASMVSQTSGVVIQVSLKADTYGAEDIYLPGATSIGELLEEQGYSQVLLLGSNAEFHGRETYFSEHGNYEILDIEAIKAAGRLPDDYNEWWGFEDQKLFRYAREELTRLAETGAPFNFTMLTADTHFPDGYHCSLCEDIYDAPYANVLACSSRQVAEFVSWIQEQPFYENTTIVISGDHLTMDADFMQDIDPNYTRTVYNCFINSASEPVKEKNRRFGTFDLFPTTLVALGVEIEGDRLALGTNLFSERETLTEQFGYDYLAEELQKQSDFYNTELLWIRD